MLSGRLTARRGLSVGVAGALILIANVCGELVCRREDCDEPPNFSNRSPAAGSATFALQAGNEWGSPVFDLHFHLRPQPANNLAHLDGAATKANLLTWRCVRAGEGGSGGRAAGSPGTPAMT
jgi:hypothetical protein